MDLITKNSTDVVRSQNQISIVFAVFPDRETAKNISRRLVEMRLIACANIYSEHTSIYEWQGKLEETAEIAVSLKTRSELVEKVISQLKALHSYEVPAILAWRVDSANHEYESWVLDQTRS